MLTSQSDHSIVNSKYQLLLKEIDIIADTIKNLDVIIYKTKNFAFAFWGGSIFLITKLLKNIYTNGVAYIIKLKNPLSKTNWLKIIATNNTRKTSLKSCTGEPICLIM